MYTSHSNVGPFCNKIELKLFVISMTRVIICCERGLVPSAQRPPYWRSQQVALATATETLCSSPIFDIEFRLMRRQFPSDACRNMLATKQQLPQCSGALLHHIMPPSSPCEAIQTSYQRPSWHCTSGSHNNKYIRTCRAGAFWSESKTWN